MGNGKLLQDRTDISAVTPMPTERVDDSSIVTDYSDTLTWFHLNTGNWVSATGEAAGTLVWGRTKYDSIQSASKTTVGSNNSSSFAFSASTRFDERIHLAQTEFAILTLMSPTDAASWMAEKFTAGQYAVDHNRGWVWGISKDTVADDAVTYSYRAPVSGGSATAQGTYNSTLPTLANGEEASLQLDDRGMLIVTLGRLLAGEDQPNGVIAVFQKPLPSITYASSVDQSTALETGSVITNEAGNLFKLGGYIDATLGNGTYYLQICNDTAVGNTNFAMAPIKYVHASGTDTPVNIDCTPFGIHGSSGLVWQLSSNADPWSYTAAGAYGNITTLFK